MKEALRSLWTRKNKARGEEPLPFAKPFEKCEEVPKGEDARVTNGVPDGLSDLLRTEQTRGQGVESEGWIKKLTTLPSTCPDSTLDMLSDFSWIIGSRMGEANRFASCENPRMKYDEFLLTLQFCQLCEPIVRGLREQDKQHLLNQLKFSRQDSQSKRIRIDLAPLVKPLNIFSWKKGCILKELDTALKQATFASRLNTKQGGSNLRGQILNPFLNSNMSFEKNIDNLIKNQPEDMKHKPNEKGIERRECDSNNVSDLSKDRATNMQKIDLPQTLNPNAIFHPSCIYSFTPLRKYSECLSPFRSLISNFEGFEKNNAFFKAISTTIFVNQFKYCHGIIYPFLKIGWTSICSKKIESSFTFSPFCRTLIPKNAQGSLPKVFTFQSHEQSYFNTQEFSGKTIVNQKLLILSQRQYLSLYIGHDKNWTENCLSLLNSKCFPSPINCNTKSLPMSTFIKTACKRFYEAKIATKVKKSPKERLQTYLEISQALAEPYRKLSAKGTIVFFNEVHPRLTNFQWSYSCSLYNVAFRDGIGAHLEGLFLPKWHWKPNSNIFLLGLKDALASNSPRKLSKTRVERGGSRTSLRHLLNPIISKFSKRNQTWGWFN